MKAIEVENLIKRYGSANVLNGINLTVEKGEVFGFVGHNGAGKSTFIHTLTGITRKSSGSFSILGTPGGELDRVKKKIGVMPDIANLYQHMRGIDFLRYMGNLAGDMRTKRSYEELLEEVGLKGAGGKKIKSYSFGMKKKISIAQALLGDPELIILDEPTSGLDPESAIVVRKMVTRLQEEGKTIFLTSHNLDEIEKVSDRVGILTDGVIKKLGTPRELKAQAEGGVQLAVRTKPVLTAEVVNELKEKSGLNLAFVETKREFTLLQLPSDDELPRLTRALLDGGVDLYEVKVEERSLEDVFMNA
ncbi:ABC-2 type transport system ATP-binding protein [Scopulibacillus darangshiensis]|uniref:ABC-2 type transport system ATP-binding protein n=1 Tax=Scopulibacillus darangshiensis TaxID=442528 RepID=A0A4R2PAK0_9BACL|nr:ABC transporter ATP-binding protein [Scopulibacillus darangshiensis]TCP30925.1 ABC-2 type transport system ATP-binding protein [Scopulibacillus darangshiensis]